MNKVCEICKGALCPKCFSKFGTGVPSQLVEGEDFYREGQAIVFTRAYHLKRGYCCKSSEAGCRHCPYRAK